MTLSNATLSCGLETAYRMSSSSPLRSRPRPARRLVLAVAAAILFAGIAQAAHFHKDELTGGQTTDIHCLLCLFAAGSATPPAIPVQPVQSAVRYCSYRFPSSGVCPPSHQPVPYEARGPPLV
jgi:hypothetical protein